MLRNINNIGYNLFPRERNFPVIAPTALPVVTAQFYATASTEHAQLWVVNDGSMVSIDWGDGTVQQENGSENGLWYEHTYATSADDYIVSVHAVNCSSMQLNTLQMQTALSTIAIEGLGYGMMATIRLTPGEQLELQKLPFYDALSLSSTSIETLDFGTYPYLSSITCSNYVLATILAGQDNFANMVFCNLCRCSLSSQSVDLVLSLLNSTTNDNGLCMLNNQTPPAIPSSQGFVDASNLVARGWNIRTDV